MHFLFLPPLSFPYADVLLLALWRFLCLAAAAAAAAAAEAAKKAEEEAAKKKADEDGQFDTLAAWRSFPFLPQFAPPQRVVTPSATTSLCMTRCVSLCFDVFLFLQIFILSERSKFPLSICSVSSTSMWLCPPVHLLKTVVLVLPAFIVSESRRLTQFSPVLPIFPTAAAAEAAKKKADEGENTCSSRGPLC